MTSSLDRVTVVDRYEAAAGKVQLTGIHALARLPIEQHRQDVAQGLNVATFISGYPGSPLGGLDLELQRQQRLLEANDVLLVPGLNEESAATAIQGTQLVNGFGGASHDGVVGIWYGKAPGLDRATDAFRHGNLMGAHPRGGALVLVGDDPAAKSSSVPCTSEFAFLDLAMPFVSPTDPQDIIDLGLHAIELSRVTGLWVGMKVVTGVADGSSTVNLQSDRARPIVPRGAKRHEPTAHLLQPRLGVLERDLMTTRLRLAREYSRLNGLNRVVGSSPDDVVGIVASGHTYLEAVETLERLGIAEGDLESSPVRLLRIGMPYPLEESTVREFASGLSEIVVVEEKRSFLEAALRDILYGLPSAPRVSGKRDPDGAELVPSFGELDVDSLAPLLRRRLSSHAIGLAPDQALTMPVSHGRRQLPLVQRTPYFCSGCPHNSSTKPVEGALVGGGIGCHAMVLMMDEAQVGDVTGISQMGGEGLQWIGMSPYLGATRYVQNLGDGTFDHSGSLAIRAAVAADVTLTYRLLYNSAVAMTGGQRSVGGKSVSQVVDLLLAEGVSQIVVTTENPKKYRRMHLPREVMVWDRTRMDEALRVLADVRGVTVLIHDQECATETRRKRKRGLLDAPTERVFINERVCEGCGDCGRKSNCLSVHPIDTEFGRKTHIHQSSCNVDLSCLEGDCPAFLTVTPDPSAPAGPTSDEGDREELHAPTLRVGTDQFGVRLMGIGGTGVVTASQVLANAGLIAGWHVRSLDQTGLAQKGGAVIGDVRFSRATTPASNKLAAGECDLYVGCDILVAAETKNLTVASRERTIAVLSTSVVPTGFMVSDPSVVFPAIDQLSATVVEKTRDDLAIAFDARALAVAWFGDDQFANMLLIGAAFQQGAIPLPAEAIEEAIQLNGVAVDINVRAFRRGRRLVIEPALATAHLPARSSEGGLAVGDVTATVEAAHGSELERLVSIRSRELVAYQDRRYARRYTQVVEHVRSCEAEVVPESAVLAEAVSRNLFKLMAYKDEYEVARLSLEEDVRRQVAQQFGPDATVKWRIHPPSLRALGMQRKLALGPWFAPVFRALRASRRLRGTPFDPFGRAEVRRVERQLIEDYLTLVDHLLNGLTADNIMLAVEVAELPDVVRGYEDVKLRSVDRYLNELAAAVSRFDSTTTQTHSTTSHLTED